MPVTIQWISHAAFRITNEKVIIYIDPWKLTGEPHDGSVVLVSHGHYDHHSAEDVAKVSHPQTTLISTPDVIDQCSYGQTISPGQTIELPAVSITAVAAYNPDKQFHPKNNMWVGFIIQLDGIRIYYAGDTDMIPEMKGLTNIDLALMPIGGTYTMNAAEAAEAVNIFKPQKALPYHWGDFIGNYSDAEKFARAATCETVLLKPGESTTL